MWNLCNLTPPVTSYKVIKGFKARENSIKIGDNPAWFSCEVVTREIWDMLHPWQC